MSSKKILIVCYSFPPNDGIGGRRWAKLAKGLVQIGHQVHVIKLENKHKGNSVWTNDVKDINVVEIPLLYPSIVDKPESSIMGRIKYRYSIYSLKRKVRGNIYDRTALWKDRLHLEMKKLVDNEGIQNIIVTGAPFDLFYHSALFKNENPSINLLIDFRDPWLRAKNYGMDTLTDDRRDFEKTKCEYSIKKSNKVLSPSMILLDETFDALPNSTDDKNKCYELKHFYDDSSKDYSAIENDEILFVYAGASYTGLEESLLELEKSLTELKNQNVEIYNKVVVKFYTDANFSHLFADHKSIVQYLDPIGDKIHDELRKARFILIIAADINKDFRTTKYFDFSPYKVPYLYCGPTGFLSESIAKDKIGYILEDHSIEELLKAPATHTYDYEKDSLGFRVTELDSMLI